MSIKTDKLIGGTINPKCPIEKDIERIGIELF